MAAGTFQADAEEELAEHGDELFGASGVAKNGHRSIPEGAPL